MFHRTKYHLQLGVVTELRELHENFTSWDGYYPILVEQIAFHDIYNKGQMLEISEQ